MLLSICLLTKRHGHSDQRRQMRAPFDTHTHLACSTGSVFLLAAETLSLEAHALTSIEFSDTLKYL